MISKTTEIPTDQPANEHKPVVVEPQRPETANQRPSVTLRPELRAAFEASWAHNEAAYRYLGR